MKDSMNDYRLDQSVMKDYHIISDSPSQIIHQMKFMARPIRDE